MAYASVASLLETIDLVNYHGDSSISSRFKDQITSLHQHTSFLQSFLEDDPKRANNWEETIRDVADRAEEIIDLLVSDSLLKSSKSEEVNGGFDELERVTVEMESTADRVKGRGTKAKVEPDEELMKIVSLLCEGSPNLETISIVGLPGMGKSTLARNAYNHPSVTENFELRAWSTVGQVYSGRNIVRDLLRCINIETETFSDNEAIERLYRSLMGRRYLIVLDDIWSLQAWDEVRNAFPNNRKGSRILVTARLSNLAAKIAGHVHEMRLLDGDGAWNLLRERIFNGDPCPFQLEHFGKMIAKSCRGHLLSIEVVSGILAADQTKAAWEDVSENIGIALKVSVIGVILSLSYTYLPHSLRPCFLYLGCFPDHNEIRVSKLIKLWVAEGFLTQSETKTFQEIGEEHVEVLVRRSLVSVSKRKSNGRIKSITVHDLVRHLCLRQAQMGNFFNNIRSLDRFDELQPWRRVSISIRSPDFLEDIQAPTIRSVVLYGAGAGWSMRNARLLRILDLSNASDKDLRKEVFELFHLRYLAFHSLFDISEAISNLQNLQTLIIYHRETWEVLCNLPKGIWRMPQLRHLLSISFKLPPLEKGQTKNSALENLETLSRVVDFICSRENLKMIPNVKKLNILFTKSLLDAIEDIELQNLISLHKLEILKIEMEWSSPVENHTNKMSFAFPPTLKKLNLCGVQFLWEDMKIVASLPNLEVLKLRNHTCVDGKWETSEGGFSRLTYLMIEGSDLKEWITKSSHFPRLKNLVLRSCLHLSKVPREIGEIPTLELIELDGESQSLVNSVKQIQEDRENLGDELYQNLVLEQRKNY